MAGSREKARTPKPAPTPDASAEGQALAKIQELYQDRKYEEARTAAQAFEKRYPRGRHIHRVYNLHGLTLLAVGRAEWAIPFFEEALRLDMLGYSSTGEKYEPYIRYNLATAQHQAGRAAEARASMERLVIADLDESGQTKAHTLRAQFELRDRHPIPAAQELLQAAALFNREPGELQIGNPTYRLIENSFQACLIAIKELPPLENLLQTHENSPLGDRLLYRIAQLQDEAKKPDDAARTYRLLSERYPLSPYYAEAFEKGKSAWMGTPPSPGAGESTPLPDVPLTAPTFTARTGHVIGVLLPLTGKFAAIGKNALEAIRLGFRAEESGDNGTIRIIAEDAGETADSAKNAFEKLVNDQNALVVIGPLLSKGADEIVKRAEEMGVPLVTLAQGIHVRTSIALQSAVTAVMQARDLARYAVEKEGAKKIVILHPQNRFGEEYSQAFWDAVKASGGEVVAKGSYAPNETDFRIAVDKLVGLHDLEARKDELVELARIRKELNITKRTPRTEKYFQLPPKVDYDAVFIPDEAKVVGQILGTFRYRDVTSLKYLGISTWNSRELIERAGQTAEGAIFTDFFFSGSESTASKSFVERFEEKMGSKPGPVEALAFDAASLLDRPFRSAGGDLSREDLWTKLGDAPEFSGVTGRLKVKSYELQRKLRILTVRGGRFVEID